MGSAADEIVKLEESLKLLDIDEIIGKAPKMHAAEAYSHAKEAYSLRDEFYKLIEQHAHADHLDSGTKERLSLPAAASLNAAVAIANMSSRAADSAQDKSALLAAKTASTKLDYGERLARRKAVREGLARGKIDFLLEEEKIRLEAQGKAEEEEDAAPPEAVAVAAANVAASERRARREAVREGLARAKIDLLREEEGRRLEEEGKAEKEYRKKKREEENKMRDDKRKQKMDKNTKPKGKGKGKK